RVLFRSQSRRDQISSLSGLHLRIARRLTERNGRDRCGVEDQFEEQRSRGAQTALAKDSISDCTDSATKCSSGRGAPEEKTVKSNPVRICCSLGNRRRSPPSEEAGNVASAD